MSHSSHQPEREQDQERAHHDLGHESQETKPGHPERQAEQSAQNRHQPARGAETKIGQGRPGQGEGRDAADERACQVCHTMHPQFVIGLQFGFGADLQGRRGERGADGADQNQRADLVACLQHDAPIDFRRGEPLDRVEGAAFPGRA